MIPLSRAGGAPGNVVAPAPRRVRMPKEAGLVWSIGGLTTWTLKWSRLPGSRDRIVLTRAAVAAAWFRERPFRCGDTTWMFLPLKLIWAFRAGRSIVFAIPATYDATTAWLTVMTMAACPCPE